MQVRGLAQLLQRAQHALRALPGISLTTLTLEGTENPRTSPEVVVQVRGLAQLLQRAQHALQALLLALPRSDAHARAHLRQRARQLSARRLCHLVRLLRHRNGKQMMS